jgi:hypothetical protein
MSKIINDILTVNGSKRDDLMKLPVRKWDDVNKTYDSLMILADGKKHDSGWGMIVIIGCISQNPVEIAVCCADDITWHFNQTHRMDCALPSRAMHFWCAKGKGKYRVGCALSSTDVWLDA